MRELQKAISQTNCLAFGFYISKLEMEMLCEAIERLDEETP